MLPIAALILTHNEELHIGRAIASLQGLASEIFIIDSFSTDNTVSIARAMGAVVLQNRFTSHAAQFTWGMDNAPITQPWILRLDADEIIEPALRAELLRELPRLAPGIVGINLKRRHIFQKRWIRHGGRYPVTLLRLWRRGHGRVEDRWMDEHVIVEGGRTVTMKSPFSDHNLKDITFFTDKHNKYATCEAVDIMVRRHGLLPIGHCDQLRKNGNAQGFVKRFVKDNIYNAIPFPVSSLGYFLYRYTIRLGFLDGGPGLVYHFLQGYWYRFLVGVKAHEFQQALAPLATKQEKLDRLRALTGLALPCAPAVDTGTEPESGSACLQAMARNPENENSREEKRRVP